MVARPGGAMAVARYHFWLVARYHLVDWATGGVADGGVDDGGVDGGWGGRGWGRRRGGRR